MSVRMLPWVSSLLKQLQVAATHQPIQLPFASLLPCSGQVQGPLPQLAECDAPGRHPQLHGPRALQRQQGGRGC
jgi:hypothetical protein